MGIYGAEKYTNDEIIGKSDYGVAMGKPQDVMTHAARNIPPVKGTALGLVPIGPNHDLGDE